MNFFESSCDSAISRLRRHHQIDRVTLHVRGHQNVAAHAPQLHNFLAIQNRPQMRLFLLRGARDDGAQVLARRIAHQNLHQEPVELRLRQRIRALHLDRILRGHHQKRRFQLVRGGAAGDGVLLHGLEQRGLRLRRRAIDFVGQHQVRENRTRLEAQRLGAALPCR